MCVVSNLFDNLCANTGTQAHTQTAKHQLVRSHPADRTGYRLLFIYGEEVKLDHKVSLNVQKKPLREVLNLLFANKPISYKITGKHILLQKRPQTRKPEVHCQWIRDRRSVCRNADWCKYSLRVVIIRELPPILTVSTASLLPEGEASTEFLPIWDIPASNMC